MDVRQLWQELGENSLEEALHKVKLGVVYSDFAVAIIHNIKRLDSSYAKLLQDLDIVDERGFTKECFEAEIVQKICKNVPIACRTASYVVSKAPLQQLCYTPKYEQDKWKKLRNDAIDAVIEPRGYSCELCAIETDLRNIMRRYKEIPSLRKAKFLWLVTVPKEVALERLLSHYFGQNFYIRQNNDKKLALSWGEKLGMINMRQFVCKP